MLDNPASTHPSAPAQEGRQAAFRYAVLFPGQGSQHAGMGAALRTHHASARETFEEASGVLGLDVAALCDEQPVQRLNHTLYAQPALLTCSVAAWRVLQAELGLEPVIGAGHSVGEFSALVCSGVLAFADAVRLVHSRGRLMQEAAPLGVGGMAVVFGVPAETVEAVCAAVSAAGQRVWIANYNSAEQAVISGEAAAVREACTRLGAAGGLAHPLAISIPAHSPLMKAAAEGLAAELAPVILREGRWPVLSNRTVQPHRSAAEMKENLVLQLTQAVQWRRTMLALREQKVDAVLEVGPKTVLRDLFKLEVPGQVCFSVGEPAGVEAVRRFLEARTGSSPADVAPALEWEDFLGRCLAVAVATRNRSTEPGKYAVGVVEPYRKLEAMRHQQREAKRPPSAEEIRQGAELLRRMLRTKRVPEPERVARMARLLEETRTAALLPDFEP
jgi:[acyl-carrier-protein] S-malonyltransferase